MADTQLFTVTLFYRSVVDLNVVFMLCSSDSVMCVYVYIYIIFHILFHDGLPQNTK